MVNISRSFLASIRTISNRTPNPTEVYEAMRLVFKTSLEYKHSIYVKNIYTRLKKEKVSTTTVEELSKRLCRTLPSHRKKTHIGIINNWKLQDAHKDLRKWKRKNTEEWRNGKKTIAENDVEVEFQRLWKREINRYEKELEQKENEKIQHLVRKYKGPTNRNKEIPEEIKVIIGLRIRN